MSEKPQLVLLADGSEARYASDAPPHFVPSGLPSLDAEIIGAFGGELTLIAGAPGQGKTSLAMQWCISAAEHGHKAAILSLEMTREGLMDRLVSGLTAVKMRSIRTRTWTPEEKVRCQNAAKWLRTIPLYADMGRGCSPENVRQRIIGWQEYGIGLGVVDYLQHMAGAGDSRTAQVTDAVQAVKAGALESNIPILGISSLNRAASLKDGNGPQFAHLRDSGALEYAADTILMFEYEEDDKNNPMRQCRIHVVKQRQGPNAVISLRFNKPKTQFEEMPQ